jgi:DNA primase
MPGIDFQRACQAIHIEQVLKLLQFQCTVRRGEQWYGSCPLHESEARHRRAFSVNIARSCYCCHKCGSHGDQLQLWSEATQQPLCPATIALCQRLGIDVPWLHRW